MRLLRYAAVSLVLLVAACTAPSPSPTPSTAPSSVDGLGGVRPNSGVLDGGVVDPPKSGAWLGAWVRPPQLTQPGRVSAVRRYEKQIGRPLRIVNTYRRLDEPFDTASDRQLTRKGTVLMLSWATGDTRSITLGHDDRVLRQRADELKKLGAKVLLRVRWEMDRPNLAATMWSPADYIAAWHHIRSIFRSAGVTNVSWVWCPTADGFANGRAPAFYPGDDAVDWVCVDAYAGADFAPLKDLLAPFLAWAAARPKPIVVGEFGVARSWGSRIRAGWLSDGLAFVRTWPQIKAVSYFESNPDDTPPTQQFRLADDAVAFDAYRKAVGPAYFAPLGGGRS